MPQSAFRTRFDLAGTACRSACFFSHLVKSLVLFLVLLAARDCVAAELDGLLDFTATWCGPCQQMSPIVSRLERQGAPIRKIDIDQQPGLAKRFGVESIPCFILVSNGQEIDRVTGLTSEQQLRSMLNRLPKPAPIAKTLGEGPRDELASHSGLGKAVPITPAKSSNQGKNPFAILPLGGKDREVAAAETPQIVRGQNSDDQPDPLRAAVRLRVKNGTTINFGSGTIIDSRSGQSVILTCGHIFRDLSSDAVIEVDLYANAKAAKPDTVIGRVAFSDLTADIGVVTISYPQRLPSVKLGSLDKPLAKLDRLVSIGCSGGDNPSRQDHQLTAINRYNGPDNLECTGVPQQGRSGGGLFRGDELVGVCIAADTKQARGIYTGLKPIVEIISKINPYGEQPQREIKLVSTDIANQAAMIEDDLNRMLDRDAQANAGIGLGAASAGSAGDDLAGAEVVCIVRSRTPGVPSRVIIVNQASERFVADLLHESRGDAGIRQANRGPFPAAHADAANSGPVETSYESKPYRRSPQKSDR